MFKMAMELAVETETEMRKEIVDHMEKFYCKTKIKMFFWEENLEWKLKWI